jgi:RHS repeat-associated protein
MNFKNTESILNINNPNKAYHSSTNLGVFITVLISSIFLINIGTIFAQNTQTTSNKADSNLKSSARVNPSTLAMEFSLPLMNYPGRNGNSIPIALNYSSKLWNMKMERFRHESGVTGNPLMPYFYRQSTDVGIKFAEKSISGWTSTLRPPMIMEEVDLYNQFGGLFKLDFGEQSLNLESECHLVNHGLVTDGTCGSGVGVLWGVECCTDLPGGGTLCEEDYADRHVFCAQSPTMIPPDPGPGNPTPAPMPTPTPEIAHQVKRIRIQMPDGSSHEFRKDDAVYNCSQNQLDCYNPGVGTYLSVDSTAMRLERGEIQPEMNNEVRDVLYLPNGSRYIFQPTNSNTSSGLLYTAAEKFIDSDGNTSVFNDSTHTWTDTLGREITDFFPNTTIPNQTLPGPQPITLKGIANENINYQIEWKTLSTAFESSATQLHYMGDDTCIDVMGSPLSPSLFASDPVDNHVETNNGQALDVTLRNRACNGYGSANLFDPLVIGAITYPNGEKYEFKYNEYAEITKISYPTGGYERFVYGDVAPLGVNASYLYTQSNRGVKKRYVSFDGVTDNQEWTYDIYNYPSEYKVKTTTPDESYTERFLVSSEQSLYGFENPSAGMVLEERNYDTNGQLRSRTLNDWIVTGPQGTGADSRAKRDPKVKRSVSIIIEGTKALATMSETEYEIPGSSGVPSDLSYFAHLNPKQTKSYHFVEIPKATAIDTNLSWSTIETLFANAQVASISQNTYKYDEYYKARGISSLPDITKVLNPSNSADILAQTQVLYDEAAYFVADSGDLSGDAENTWENPSSDTTVQSCQTNLNKQCRGNPTTSKVWDKDTGDWIQTHTQYDQYGNVRKVWDAISNMTETQYGAQYHYAYLTKIIAPAPDPANTGHGTTDKSEATTTYDFNTGLPLTVTSLNDLTTSGDDQTTATEYDNMLRPFRVYPVNFVAPETRTGYGVTVDGKYPENQRFVKVRKQIDANNWDEAITWFDGLGRTIKTQAKDSQGDVFTQTKYDNFGRVKWTSNPYRSDDTKYWSRPRYDELGRVFESCAPVEDSTQNPLDFNANGACPSGASLGTTSWSISTVTDFVGTVVTSTDASGRKSRLITNALGQLLRVDEPTAVGGASDADLGTLASPYQPTYYYYSPQGKMVKVKQGKDDDPYIQYRYFLYDPLGRLIRVRQPEQEVNSALNLTDPITGNNQWTAAFTYDIVGNVLTATDANGTIITNTYDKANRITTKTYTAASGIQSTPSVSYFYDGKGLDQQQSPNVAKGKLTKVTSSVSETRYTQFDSLGRLTKMEQRTPLTGETISNTTPHVSSYQYNFAGALIAETYPSGRVVRNDYEADGDLSRIYGKATTSSAERTYANAFTYTPDGRIEKLRLGNNRTEWAKFNERLQVTELALGLGVTDAGLWDLKYEYGELNTDGTVNAAKNTGNIAKQTINFAGLPQPLVQTYKYDSLYRLKEAKEAKGTASNAPQTWLETFDYDRFGNREAGLHSKYTGTNSISLNSITNPTINKNNNRFSDEQGYQYDKNGNLIQSVVDTNVVRTVVFNGDNKQKYVVENNKSVGEYFYDGEGKRVKKLVYEADGLTVKEETVFVYSGSKLVAEFSTKPVATNPTTSYTATDQLGSPRVITDSKGDVVSRRDFMPFGEEVINNTGERQSANTSGIQSSTTDLKYNAPDNVRQKFTGYQKDDETSLDFAEARMYENRHGRFTAVDPLLASGKSANPQTFNRFVYVGNNPITMTDPSGLQAGWAIDFRNKSPSGEERPWVYFNYFENPIYRETYNGANGTNFQPFNGLYYIYGDRSYAYLSRDGRYYEGKISTFIDPEEYDTLLALQSFGQNAELDKKMNALVLENFAPFTGSRDATLAADPLKERLLEIESLLIASRMPTNRLQGMDPISPKNVQSVGSVALKPITTFGNSEGKFNFALGLHKNGALQEFAAKTNSKTYVDLFGKEKFDITHFRDASASADKIFINRGNGFSFSNYRQWLRDGRPMGEGMVTNFEIWDTNLKQPDKIRWFTYPSNK